MLSFVQLYKQTLLYPAVQQVITVWRHLVVYYVDVLWGQPIKLIQIVSTLEFHEFWWNDLEVMFLVPAAQKLEHKEKHNYFTYCLSKLE